MPKATGKKSAAKAPAAAAEPAAASSGEKATGGLGLLSSMYGDDDDDDDAEAAAVQAARTSSSTMVVQAAPYVMAEAPRGHELAVLDKGTEDKKTSQTVVYGDHVESKPRPGCATAHCPDLLGRWLSCSAPGPPFLAHSLWA